jgi:hypothetical protein
MSKIISNYANNAVFYGKSHSNVIKVDKRQAPLTELIFDFKTCFHEWRFFSGMLVHSMPE